MSERPRLLVTGDSGYLGQRLVRRAQGHWDVTTTYFSHQPLIPGCRWTKLDVRDAKGVLRLFEQVVPQVVIHTAAHRSGEELERVNVDGTRHVALAALQVGARMIHLSTDILFDGQRGNYVESAPPSPIIPYGRSKADAETLLAELMPQAIVVRTSLIYGFDPLDRHTNWMLDMLRQGQPVRLFTDERRCPIWVETLAALEYVGVLHVAGGAGAQSLRIRHPSTCFSRDRSVRHRPDPGGSTRPAAAFGLYAGHDKSKEIAQDPFAGCG